MAAKAGLNRAILGKGWGGFLARLEQAARYHGARTYGAATVAYWFPQTWPELGNATLCVKARPACPTSACTPRSNAFNNRPRARVDRIQVVGFDGAGGFEIRPIAGHAAVAGAKSSARPPTSA